MVSTIGTARLALITSASALALLAAPAFAQTKTAAATTAADEGIEEIIVTAQRVSQSLQDVPIAVSAFTAEALDRQQIDNASDLQLTLPNVVFSKGNFTGSSFTIRGIGDLCVGGTCDSATAIHSNDLPLFGTRLFETEYFDLERVEVLRGPQGTLFGRNATSGVVNFITAKPKMGTLAAAAEAEYGNYNSIKGKAMVNVPIGDKVAARVAGYYLNRDGYTKNLYNNQRIDGRDMYAIRGSVRAEPTDDTTIDLMGYYFHEKDDRLRIQKQLCQRDPTGVLGCTPGARDYNTSNSNSTFVGVLSSREFFAARLGAAFAPLALGSLYGPDPYAGSVNPADPRVVSTAYTPKYFTDEIQAQAVIEHNFGGVKAKLSGQYQRNKVDSSQDYNLAVQSAAGFIPGLTAFNAYANSAAGLPAPVAALFAQAKPGQLALIPNGPAGPYCTSLPEESGTGAFSGKKLCGSVPLAFDRSTAKSRAYTGEAIIESQFDGRFNFLLGGIYNDIQSTNVDYYVNSFGIDYLGAVLGLASTIGAQTGGNPAFPNSFGASPFFRSNQNFYKLKSYGLFGEAYFNITDTLKLTGGIRYNNDKKNVSARTTLISDANSTTVLVPYGSNSITQAVNYGAIDFDANRTGNQLYSVRSVSFDEVTGRVVLDWKVTDDNLIYASYSRGYKSGGVNPPLSPVFAVGDSFAPEFIDSFEVGSKNTFLDGTLRINLTGFYYKYKALQLSRIVARTSVNDNVDANIYGLEMDAILAPTRSLLFNIGASYLNTKVAKDKFLANPRDPSGGRGDAVIIKDITNGSNCAVVPTTAGSAAANTFVAAANNVINSGAIPGFTNPNPGGLRAPTAFAANSGLNPTTTGAFSICAVLNALAPSVGAAVGGVSVLNEGVTVNIKGNRLPQAPNYKFSIGGQYTVDLPNGMTVVPRADLIYTGDSYGNVFNGNINRIKGYSQINAQIQLNGKDDRWFARAFVQNLTDNSAITGLYVTDQSSGLFTNIFTLEPRRYGVAAGVKF